MFVSTLRELQKHAQEVRLVVGASFARTELNARCIPSRAGDQVSIHVGDDYGEVGAGRSRFATKLPGLLGAYYETWTALGRDRYQLSKGYLHLFASTSPTESLRELIFLHTEPSPPPAKANARAVRMAKWKTGPHLHVKASSFGLGRCHMHVDVFSNPCRAHTSLSGYRDYLKLMTEMLADELEEYFDPSEIG